MGKPALPPLGILKQIDSVSMMEIGSKNLQTRTRKGKPIANILPMKFILFSSIETRQGAIFKVSLCSSPKFGISGGNQRFKRHWGRNYTTDTTDIAALPIYSNGILPTSRLGFMQGSCAVLTRTAKIESRI